MALDTFDKGYDYHRYPRNTQEEFENIKRQLYEVSKEVEYWKSIAAKTASNADIVSDELRISRQYTKVLELALYIATGSDEKKKDVLTQAKTSIDVLKTFEK
jgi:hypothetical protein